MGFILPKGMISLYAISQTGINGLQAPKPYNFGKITGTWYNDAYPPFKYTSVMFDGGDIIKLVYPSGITLSVIDENKIKLIETGSS